MRIYKRKRHPGHLQIAIDGLVATGKSTVGLAVAQRLEIQYLDTGIMYRAVALAVYNSGIDPLDESACGHVAEIIEIRIIPATIQDHRQQTVLLGSEDVTWNLRSAEVTEIVAKVSSHPRVRKALHRLQNETTRKQGVVMVGRDITSVVLPYAQVKVILEASLDTRVQRRVAELRILYPEITVDANRVQSDMEQRDALDTSKMQIPEDAIIMQTDNLTIEEVVEQIVRMSETARYKD